MAIFQCSGMRPRCVTGFSFSDIDRSPGSPGAYTRRNAAPSREGHVHGSRVPHGLPLPNRFRLFSAAGSHRGFCVSNEGSTTRRRPRVATPRARLSTAAPADPLLQLLDAMQGVNAGDFSVRLPLHWDGIEGKLANAFNEIVASNRRLAAELARVGQKVGRQGQTRQRVLPAARQGCWAEMEESVNHLIDDLVRPVETITEAMAGVAKGGPTRTVPLAGVGGRWRGGFWCWANTEIRLTEQWAGYSSKETALMTADGPE